MPPRTPQVPGEVASKEPVTEQLADQVATADPQADAPAVTEGEGNSTEETVTVSKATLDALLARVERLESAKASPSARVANPEAELPHQDEVNPDKIKSPVLTKQGWVVPTNFGANPAAKAL